MATKPRLLGNKAAAMAKEAARHARIATNLQTDALTNFDRRPDTAIAQIRDARYHTSQAEAIINRLRAGDFTED